MSTQDDFQNGDETLSSVILNWYSRPDRIRFEEKDDMSESDSFELDDILSSCSDSSSILDDMVVGSSRKERIPKRIQSLYSVFYFDFSIDHGLPQRVIITLFTNASPVAVENFARICEGKTNHPLYGYPLKYHGCYLFKVVKNQYFLTGDVELNTGHGGYSAMGMQYFTEHSNAPLSDTGTVYMNIVDGVYRSIGSQFFISVISQEHLKNIHVPIGKVTSGLNIIEEIVSCGTISGMPNLDIYISDCGILQM